MMIAIVLCSDINDESNYNETDNYDEANYDYDNFEEGGNRSARRKPSQSG